MYLSFFQILLTRCVSYTAATPRDINSRRLTETAGPNLGVFDKGSEYDLDSGSVKLSVPSALFCGTEAINDVAERLNARNRYNTSLSSYLSDLERAELPQRKAMLSANFGEAVNEMNVPSSCRRLVSQAYQDQIARLERSHSNPQHYTINILKLATDETDGYGIAVDILSPNMNGTAPPDDAAQLAIMIVARAVLRQFNRHLLNRPLPKEVDQWRALLLTMFSRVAMKIFQMMQLNVDGRDDPFSCGEMTSDYIDDVIQMLGSYNGHGNLPVRPVEQVGIIRGLPSHEACPTEYIEPPVI